MPANWNLEGLLVSCLLPNSETIFGAIKEIIQEKN